MKMDFIGIGAQKCASTWISNILRSHPAIEMPEHEPLDFFSYVFENGYRWYDAQIPAEVVGTRRGEMSQSYFHEAGVVERVKQYRNDIKIIVSLRDPVERALSQHRHLVRLGAIPSSDLSFETALATNPTYREQGLYFRHLSRWVDSFGSDLVHVTFMEDIQSDPTTVAESLFRFLEVGEDHQPSALGEKRNASYVAKSRIAHRIMAGLSVGVRSVGGEKLWRSLGGTRMRRIYRELNHQPAESVIPDPKQTTLNELRSFYAPEVEQLSRMLDRDLTDWTAP